MDKQSFSANKQSFSANKQSFSANNNHVLSSVKSCANQRFIVIDGNAILHRAYHAMPPLTTSKGELVNAVYGFTSILLRIFHDFHPEYVVCCFDKKAPTFRKKKYQEYQAKRPKMVLELVGQIERVHEVVAAMNIPIFELDGYEADDIIGTLIEQVKKRILKQVQDDVGIEVIIVTGDRDLLQLVDEKVKVYLPVKGLSQSALFDEAGVKTKMGVLPQQIPDLKGLIGDQSDNYPGVSGIGSKTAQKLLEKYGTLKEIFAKLDKLDQLEPGTAKKLRIGKKMGELSFELATIRKDAPVKLDLGKCQLTDYDFEKVLALFEELEFQSMIKRLPRDIHEIEKPVEEKQADQMGLF